MRIIFTVAMFVFFTASSYALTLQEAVSLALQNDDVVKMQQALLEASGYSKDASKSPFLPKADMRYGYEHDTGAAIDTTTFFGINVSYNLFNGFIDQKAYKISEASQEVQQFKYNGARQDIILTIKSAYLSYLQTRSQVNVEKETVELLKRQKDTAEVSFSVGQMSRADVLRVDVELASSQLNLLNAEIAFKLAKQSLERYISRPLAENEVVEEIEISEYNIPELNMLYNLLETNRSELQALKLSYDIATLSESRAEGNYLPKVDASAGFNWMYDDFDLLTHADEYTDNQVYGITLSWNLFNGLYDQNTLKALAKESMASSLQLSDTRKTLKLQTSDAYETYFSAGERLRAAEVSVEYAKENYRITLTLYENSEATTTDLLDASVALNSAQNSYAAAKYGLINAVANIERAVEENFIGMNY